MPGPRHRTPTLAGLALLVLASGCGPKHRVGPDPCAPMGTAVVVEAADHMLWLCEEGRGAAHYPVSLGSGGTGKTREGDGRTPLGRYPLGAPRASARFGTFIPVGYPTADQAREGATGGEIGIHGPGRSTRWLGRLLLRRDWTRGCVALPRDRDLQAVVDWVTARKVDRIVLE